MSIAVYFDNFFTCRPVEKCPPDNIEVLHHQRWNAIRFVSVSIVQSVVSHTTVPAVSLHEKSKHLSRSYQRWMRMKNKMKDIKSQKQQSSDSPLRSSNKRRSHSPHVLLERREYRKRQGQWIPEKDPHWPFAQVIITPSVHFGR